MILIKPIDSGRQMAWHESPAIQKIIWEHRLNHMRVRRRRPMGTHGVHGVQSKYRVHENTMVYGNDMRSNDIRDLWEGSGNIWDPQWNHNVSKIHLNCSVKEALHIMEILDIVKGVTYNHKGWHGGSAFFKKSYAGTWYNNDNPHSVKSERHTWHTHYKKIIS